MDDLFRKWRGFKKDLLLEFNNQDKNEILENGGDFNVSYELELESHDRIYWDDDDYDDYDDYDYDDEYERVSNLVRENEGYEEFGYTTEDITNDLFEKVYGPDYDYAEIGLTMAGLESDEREYLLRRRHDSPGEKPLFQEFNEVVDNIYQVGTPENKKFIELLFSFERIREFLEEEGEYELGVEGLVNYQKDLYKSDSDIVPGEQAYSSAEDLFKIFVFVRDGEQLISFDYVPGVVHEYKEADLPLVSLRNVFLLFEKEHVIDELIEKGKLKVSNVFRDGNFEDEFESDKNMVSDLWTKVAEEFIDRLNDEHFPAAVSDALDYETYPRESRNDGGTSSGEDMVADHLPNFYRKYAHLLSFKKDGSLSSGIEMAHQTYFESLEEAFQFLDVFYKDYDDQSNFYMSSNTGLHTNISMRVPGKRGKQEASADEFNLMKALLFLSEPKSEGQRDAKVYAAFKGIESRINSGWTGELKHKFIGKIETILKDIMYGKKQNPMSREATVAQFVETLREPDNYIIDSLNGLIKQVATGIGRCSLGFNVTYVDEREYIEFRYPGHDVTKEVLKELTLYYCYIVKLSLEKEYKDLEYKKKLIGLLSTIKAAAKKDLKKDRKKIRKGLLYKTSHLVEGGEMLRKFKYLVEEDFSPPSTRAFFEKAYSRLYHHSPDVFTSFEVIDVDHKKKLVTLAGIDVLNRNLREDMKIAYVEKTVSYYEFLQTFFGWQGRKPEVKDMNNPEVILREKAIQVLKRESFSVEDMNAVFERVFVELRNKEGQPDSPMWDLVFRNYKHGQTGPANRLFSIIAQTTTFEDLVEKIHHVGAWRVYSAMNDATRNIWGDDKAYRFYENYKAKIAEAVNKYIDDEEDRIIAAAKADLEKRRADQEK